MKPSKPPKDSIAVLAKRVIIDQINLNGNLSNDILLSWMEQVASIAAHRHSGSHRVITVNIDHFHFKLPLKADDPVLLTASVDYVGTTSMEVGVRVERETQYTGERNFAAFASLTVVALDSHSKPTTVPKLVLETDEEQLRFEQAHLRIKVRGKLRHWLEERFPFALKTELNSKHLQMN
jgi:acyl-CoA hydrolase